MNDDRRWQMSALLTFTIAAALLVTGTARADASAGEYLGYRLGDTFVAPQDAELRPHVAGPLVYEFLTDRRDHGVETMGVYVTPESSIIGSIFGEWYFTSKGSARRFADRYLATLERKYEHWTARGESLSNEDFQLSVEVQKRSRNSTYWPSDDRYRVSVSLIHAPDSLGRSEWMAIVYLESSNLEMAASEQRADVRSP